MRRSLLSYFIIPLLIFSFSYGQNIREMKFENVKLETIIKAISEVSGMSIVFDPAISQELQKTTSISINRSVPIGEALNILLKTHGLIAVPMDSKVFRITKAGDIMFDTAGYTESQLKELINLLKVRVSPSAEIIVDRSLGKVFVKDEVSVIEQLKKLSKDIEKASIKGEQKEEYISKVFYIRKDVSYKDIAKAIGDLKIKDLVITESPEFNAVIVSGKKSDVERIEKALEKYIKTTTPEKPILTKTLYVKYLPAEEFRKLIQPMLSEVGEVYVLGVGIATTVAEEKELRDAQQRIQSLTDRLKDAPPEERVIIQQQIQQLQQRQQEVQRALQSPATQRGDTVSVGGFPTAREGLLGPEFRKDRSARVVFQNAVIVRDYADVVYKIIERYKDIVSEQPLQIKIEARVVELSNSAIRELGINWNALLSQARVPQFWGGGAGSNLGIGASPPLTPSLSPAPGGILTFTFQRGLLNSLNLRLSAYEQVGKAKSLARPVIMTLNGETAIIQSVLEFPIREVTVVPGGTTTVSIRYKLIPVHLTVTPILLPEGNMMLDITISKADIISLEKLQVDGGSVDIPTVQSQRADAKVIVKDGDLVVLGGLIKQVDRKLEKGVPGLMRVPLLKWLFMEQRIEKEDSELLIFIQPTLISQ